MLTIVPYNPVKRNELLSTRNSLDGFYNIFDDFFRSDYSKRQNVLRNVFKVDLIENDNEYIVEADLPGIAKEEISINIEDNSLVISVEHEEEETSEAKNYIHKERHLRSMKRRINLNDVKFESITAKLENGVLNIVVPKDTTTNELRKIEIA